MTKFGALLILLFFLSCSCPPAGFCVDAETPDIEEKQAVSELPYDYSSTVRVPVYLSITKQISTKDGLQEGQKLEFRVIKDVVYKDKMILKSGDIVTGTVISVNEEEVILDLQYYAQGVIKAAERPPMLLQYTIIRSGSRRIIIRLCKQAQRTAPV